MAEGCSRCSSAGREAADVQSEGEDCCREPARPISKAALHQSHGVEYCRLRWIECTPGWLAVAGGWPAAL